jgi:hypothetical protein
VTTNDLSARYRSLIEGAAFGIYRSTANGTILVLLNLPIADAT